MKFEKTVLQQILWGASEDFTIVEDEITDTGRWSVYHYMVFKDKNDNYFGVSYSEGATEMQDESPWEYEGDLIEVDELRQTQKVVTTYCGKVKIQTPFEITLQRFDEALYALSTEDMSDPLVRDEVQTQLINVYQTMKGLK